MSETSTSARHYRYIRAWCRMMGSTDDYTHTAIERARREKAPPDAVYRTVDGKWRRFADVVREDTRELIKNIVAEMEGKG